MIQLRYFFEAGLELKLSKKRTFVCLLVGPCPRVLGIHCLRMRLITQSLVD